MKWATIIVLVFLFSSCNNSNSESTAREIENPNPQRVPDQDSVNKVGDTSPGRVLMAKSDCLTCHKESGRIVGPSYSEVASKYSNKDIDILVKRVKAGSSGIWGEVPMPPHTNLSDEDAAEMIRYILSLKP